LGGELVRHVIWNRNAVICFYDTELTPGAVAGHHARVTETVARDDALTHGQITHTGAQRINPCDAFDAGYSWEGSWLEPGIHAFQAATTICGVRLRHIVHSGAYGITWCIAIFTCKHIIE
jgi:hypothetical protein